MRVSVIISTYNRPGYLKRVMEGYLVQTQAPDEIVIADDGSTEETTSLIQQISQNSKTKILHVWQEDQGFKAAQIRNKAIAQSSGEYLIICDDDSIPCLTMVEDHLRYAESGFFIQGHRVLLEPQISEHFSYKDIRFGKILQLSIRGLIGNPINALRLPIPLIRISQNMKGIRSCNMSFYRKDLLAVNGFNEDFVGWGREDSELALRFYQYGLKKKDLKFRACCFHLYHQLFSRDRLEKNIELFEETEKQGEFFCKNGINKYLIS
jgi:glycosyltransferase involved in cell wall biosynthesis